MLLTLQWSWAADVIQPMVAVSTVNAPTAQEMSPATAKPDSDSAERLVMVRTGKIILSFIIEQVLDDFWGTCSVLLVTTN